MTPDFFQSTEPYSHIGLWRTIIGICIVLFATLVGVEIKIENDDDDS